MIKTDTNKIAMETMDAITDYLAPFLEKIEIFKFVDDGLAQQLDEAFGKFDPYEVGRIIKRHLFSAVITLEKQLESTQQENAVLRNALAEVEQQLEYFEERRENIGF